MSSVHSTPLSAHLTVPRSVRSGRLYRRIEVKLRRKAVRKRTIRISLLISNVLILGFILVFILNNQASTQAAIGSTAIDSGSVSTTTVNPLDQLSSADIALTVARMAGLPETTPIANQAESQAADLAIISNNDDVVTKPQVVLTSLKSRADIVNYTTKNGDTVAALAAQYGVTSNSILWSNGLTSNTLPASDHLVIPPINGLVYTVKSGDTPASLAQKYGANAAQIIAYNDAEISGLTVGEQILIPNGAPPVAAAASPSAGGSASGGFPWGSGPMYGYNGYDFGYCTWYVATQIPVPGNWGNASSWAYYARLSGWNVSSTPTVGSIAQTADAAGGEGHVAVVTGVANGLIHIQDMNNYGDGGGWDRVGSAWVSPATFENFITH